MATIKGNSAEKVFTLTQFYGLNQNPDGDTKLKFGEAAAMWNFRVTRDGNLRKRPGTKTICDLGEEVKYLWHGYVQGMEYFLAAAGGKLYSLWDCDHDAFRTEPLVIGNLYTGGSVYIFGFAENAYILNGQDYLVFDGDTLSSVEGYVPLVAIGLRPGGGGDTLEQVNKLSAKRCVWLSPDGKGTTFQMPETGLDSFIWFKDLKTDTEVEFPYTLDLDAGTVTVGSERTSSFTADGSATQFNVGVQTSTLGDYGTVSVKVMLGEEEYGKAYSFDNTTGKLLFYTPPAAGTYTLIISDCLARVTNGFEICYSMSEDFRNEVYAMRYAEMYSGLSDSRIFLYGDGTNVALYSDINYDGKPDPTYFPDMNEIAIGDANTPITGMIRHYAMLMCFKLDSTWAVSYGTTTLADSQLAATFYCTPINRNVGNVALGQVQLVAAAPVTLHGTDVFEWKNTGSYAANLTHDERQAKRISDRIHKALSEFDFCDCFCWDDNPAQEYYICQGDKALVHNYVNDTWYLYTGLHIRAMESIHDRTILGLVDGRVVALSHAYLSDDGEPIDCYWESGAMSFGVDYQRKYSSMLWVSIKPENNGYLEVTAETDRKSDNMERYITTSLSSFSQMNFAHFSFKTNRIAQQRRLKIKTKKFVFYKLIFKTNTSDTRATVLTADIRVRFTGYAKGSSYALED